MDAAHDGELPGAAALALPPAERLLLELLCAFTRERLAQAGAARSRMLDCLAAGWTAEGAAALHAFLRECWEALDGLGREANLVMHRLFPEAGLHLPLQMTRQCTAYVVRKVLHEHPDAAGHPVSRLLWERTRGAAGEEYGRLSFLYNLSLFVPLPLPAGLLPGSEDVPDALAGTVRTQAVPRAEPGPATRGIVDWLDGLVRECESLMAEALRGATR
jgi:hypothetical protein